ncbi:hypothetical protein [Bacteroides sp. 519]|uniref:hypothetical protein n=1 Tax=Bacteroides sp. 519 TaxID=2302937 RepID=UPI0019402984|nr:hypothetical protein [Bacteroides sp. 519]NDV59054.1 hypothetical protein [Bacteroides sp. 519]
MRILTYLLIIYFTSCTHKDINKGNALYSSSFEKFLNLLDIDSLSVKVKDKPILSILFYNVMNCSYFRIYQSSEILIEKITGFTELDNFVLLYAGIDDNIASKYFVIQNINWDNFENTYNITQPCFECFNEPDKIILKELHYRIINDTTFHLIQPDDAFLKKYEEELIKSGYIISPPTPPSN